MSDISKEINICLSKVLELEKKLIQCLQDTKNDKNVVDINDCIKKMRELHGHAILTNKIYLNSINVPTSNDKICLSANYTCIDLIHRCISECDIKIHANKNNVEKKMTGGKITHRTNQKSDGIKELSINDDQLSSDNTTPFDRNIFTQKILNSTLKK